MTPKSKARLEKRANEIAKTLQKVDFNDDRSVGEWSTLLKQVEKVVKKLKGRKKLGPMPEEVKEKIRKAMIGQNKGPMDEETKMKIRAANKGRIVSKETVKKIKKAKLGKKLGPRGLQLYCGKCKSKQLIRNYNPTLKNGQPAIYAECRECKSKIFAWDKKKK